MKNTIKLDNPVQINGKSYNELTYDISEITAQAFAEADARKLSASGSKNGNAAGAAELDYGLHLYLGFAAIIAVNPEIDISDLERVRGYDVMKIMRIGRFYFREVGGTLHPRQLRRAIRDYARAFHTSTRDLGERRLTDFLTEYGEAVEEAKRLQASRPTRAASFKKPHIRRR